MGGTIKERKFTVHLLLFLISGLIVFNCYIFIKCNLLDGRIRWYEEQNKKFEQENSEFLAVWEDLRKEHEQNLRDTLYLDLQLSLLEAKLNSRINYEFYFDEILTLTPSTVQIDQITVRGNIMEIEARAGNYSDIGYYTKELEYSKLFQKVDYSYETADTKAGEYIVRNLICHIYLTL